MATSAISVNIFGKFEAYQRTYVLLDFSCLTKYLWYQLQGNLAKELGIGSIGSSIPYIKKENLAEFIVAVPVEVREQKAIVTFLSDFDEEISALEDQHTKFRAIRGGMMHQLLTGRITLK